MNGDGPFGVSRPGYNLEITAEIVPGATIEQIEKSLSSYSFSSLQKLILIFDCSLDDLSRKIAKAKGLKNVDKRKDRRATKNQG
jgi:hypothetical protein